MPQFCTNDKVGHKYVITNADGWLESWWVFENKLMLWASTDLGIVGNT